MPAEEMILCRAKRIRMERREVQRTMQSVMSYVNGDQRRVEAVYRADAEPSRRSRGLMGEYEDKDVRPPHGGNPEVGNLKRLCW